MNFHEYLISLIDLEVYDLENTLPNMFDIFHREKSWEISKLGRNKALANWLQGLPQWFRLPFWDDEISEIIAQYELNIDTEQWFDYVADSLLKIDKKEQQMQIINYNNGLLNGRIFITRPMMTIDDWETGILVSQDGSLHPVINCGDGFMPSISDTAYEEIEEVKAFLAIIEPS